MSTSIALIKDITNRGPQLLLEEIVCRSSYEGR